MNSGKKREGRQLIFAKHRLFLIGLYTFLCIISMVILPFPSVYRWRNQGSEKVKVMFMVTQVPSGRMGIWSGSVDSKGHALPTVTGCLLATWEQWKSNEQKGSVDPALPSPFSCCCEFTERSPWAPASWALPKGAINEPATAASEISVFFYGPVIPLSPLIMQQSETRSNETAPGPACLPWCVNSSRTLCVLVSCVWCGLTDHWLSNLRIWLSPEGQMSDLQVRAIFPLLWPALMGWYLNTQPWWKDNPPHLTLDATVNEAWGLVRLIPQSQLVPWGEELGSAESEPWLHAARYETLADPGFLPGEIQTECLPTC